MSKTFRPWKIDEPLLLPPVVQEFVAKDHLARLVLSLVREEIDLAAISGSYAGERRRPNKKPQPGDCRLGSFTRALPSLRSGSPQQW